MPNWITSPQNPQLKQAVRLRDRRSRDELGLCLIDGIRETTRAIEAGVHLEKLLVCGDPLGQPRLETLCGRAEQAGAAVLYLPEALFAKVAYGDRHDGLVAVAQTPNCDWNTWQPAEFSRLVVLEGVEKPGNIGAVFRSADAAGLSGVILTDLATDIYNPNAIRASLGTLFSLPVVSKSARETQAWLVEHGYRIFAARVDGALEYTQARYEELYAFVLGSEAHGLSETWRQPGVTGVFLPMLGHADSLNVSATAVVLFYEALRQRAEAVVRSTT